MAKHRKSIERFNKRALAATATGSEATKEVTRHARIRKTGPNSIEVKATKTLEELLPNLCASTGTRTNETAIRITAQIVDNLVMPRVKSAAGLSDAGLIQAINLIGEIAPQNVTEALLAAQMVATHEAALWFMCSATREDQTFEGRDANVLRSTRLMRLHLEQIEAMQKLKGKAGQQKVTVEHVHVYQGGQAIVGAVKPAKTGLGGGGE